MIFYVARWSLGRHSSRCTYFDPLNIIVSENDGLHVDGRDVNVVGIDVADFDDLLDLRDREPGGFAHRRIEVSSSFPVETLQQLSSNKWLAGDKGIRTQNLLLGAVIGSTSPLASH